MLEIQRFDDVTRVRMWTWGSAAAGLHVSAYIVRGVFVDSGFPHAGRSLAGMLGELRPAGAMITHWHEDHAGNVDVFAAHGLPVAMHEATEAKLLQRPRIRLYRRVVWGRPRRLVAPLERLEHPALQLIHTPGHSSDHQVVWDAERGTLFSGDLWLGIRARAMHPAENPYQILRSIQKVLALGPARMFDAHRGPVRHPVDALRSRAEWLAETIGTIDAKIAAGWSDRAIRRAVLGGEEPSAYISLGEYARLNFVRAVRRYRCIGSIASASAASAGV